MPATTAGPGTVRVGGGEEAAFRALAPGAERLRFLLRYAVRAPSSHNTQPWRFRVGEERVDLFACDRCRLPVADADGRELHLSLGCALENLVVAAEHFGYAHRVVLDPGPGAGGPLASVLLHEGGAARSRPPELFAALGRRRTNRGAGSGLPVDGGVLARLRACGSEPGLRLWTGTERGVREAVAALVARADRLEFADPAFRRELGRWIGRGALGTPRPFRAVARLAVTHLDLGRTVAASDAARVRDAAAVAVLLGEDDRRGLQLRAGMVLERVWLLATHLGLAVQPLSAPLQLPGPRAELGALVGAGGLRPLHLFRLDRAPPAGRRAPRRPLHEVILP